MLNKLKSGPKKHTGWLKDKDEPTLEIDGRQPGDGGGEGPGSAELGQAGAGPERSNRGL